MHLWHLSLWEEDNVFKSWAESLQQLISTVNEVHVPEVMDLILTINTQYLKRQYKKKSK